MNAENKSARYSLADQERISLCEILDRVLTKGVVVVGEVVISVADIDLIYLGLQLVLTSVESINKKRAAGGPALSQEVDYAPC